MHVHIWHVARHYTAELLQKEFNHPFSSPDLSLNYYHIVLRLTNFLFGQNFQSDEEMQMAVTLCFLIQAADFCDRGIQKNISWYGKCTNSGDEYVGKYLNDCYIQRFEGERTVAHTAYLLVFLRTSSIHSVFLVKLQSIPPAYSVYPRILST